MEENRDNILRDITRLVAVPSVEGAPEPGAPFGPGPKAAGYHAWAEYLPTHVVWNSPQRCSGENPYYIYGPVKTSGLD